MPPKVHRAAALNFAALGLSTEAERHFVKAVQLNGRAVRQGEDPRVDYGAFLFRQGRTEEALRPLEQTVRDTPASARANTELGRVLLHLNRLDAAAACLEKAVEAKPDNWNAHLLLGRAYLRLESERGRQGSAPGPGRLGQQTLVLLCYDLWGGLSLQRA